jgi:hypothetical protein
VPLNVAALVLATADCAATALHHAVRDMTWK